MNKIRLLIASEDQAIRRSLAVVFEIEKTLFDVVANGNLGTITDNSIKLQPDVILIDLPDGKLDYDIAVSEIKKQCPYTLILVLSGNVHCDNLTRILEQGIDGCVPRSIMRDALVRIVEITCQANVFCLPGYFKKNISFIETDDTNSKGQRNSSKNKKALTRREMEILQLMAGNHSNRDIADKLLISEPTVKTHVSNILRKLGQNNRAQAIVYSYRMGLVKN